MGLIDFLKTLPGISINIENKKIDNRKIVITNSKITCGEKIIEDQKILEKIFEELEKCKDDETLPFQVIHKDLVEEYLDYEEISIKEKEILPLVKKIFLPEDVECIFMARRVILAFDKNQRGVGDELKNQLIQSYPRQGRKVLNLMSAKYFDEIILPFIEIFKIEKGEGHYIQEFREFYANLLKFFPLAVFVNNFTLEEKIMENIIKRLKLDIPYIRVHSIGELNIKKVETVVNKLGLDKKYSTKDNRFNTSLGLKAQIYEIKLK